MRKIRLHRKKSVSRLAAVLIAAAVLAGCAGGVSSVALEDRDTTGRYDGVWQIEIAKGVAVQRSGNWTLNCGDMTRSFQVLVRNGTMSIWTQGPDEDPATAYVAADGRFRMAAPTGTRSQVTSSSTQLTDNENTLILNGRLDGRAGEGWYVWGVKAFGNHGCTSKFTTRNLGLPAPQTEA